MLPYWPFTKAYTGTFGFIRNTLVFSNVVVILIVIATYDITMTLCQHFFKIHHNCYFTMHFVFRNNKSNTRRERAIEHRNFFYIEKSK